MTRALLEGASRMRRSLFWAALFGATAITLARAVAWLGGSSPAGAYFLDSKPVIIGKSVFMAANAAILSIELLRMTKWARSRSWSGRQHLTRVLLLGTALAAFSVALNLLARPKAIFRKASALAHESNYKDALAELDRLLALYPQHVDGYLERAWVRRQLEDYEGAVADATAAIDLDGKNARAYYQRGWARGALGEHDAAIADLTRAIELDRNRAAPYVERGWARGQKGDYEGEIADTTSAIGLDPQNSAAYLNRGFARAATNDPQGALEDFNRVVELEPKNATAYLQRGRARYRLGDFRGAVEDWEAASKLQTDLPQDVETELAQARGKL